MRNVLTLCSGRGSNPHGILSQGILSPSFGEVSPEQTAIKGPAHPANVHRSALASQTELPRTLPRSHDPRRRSSEASGGQLKQEQNRLGKTEKALGNCASLINSNNRGSL